MAQRKSWISALLGGACCLGMLAPQVRAQQASDTQIRPARVVATEALRMPQAEPVVALSVVAPAETPVGRAFDYQIRVQNLSQNIAVHDVVIAQFAGKGIEIQSSKIQGGPSSKQSSKSDQDQDESAGDQDQKRSKQQAKKEADEQTSGKDQKDEEQKNKESDKQSKSDRQQSKGDKSKSDSDKSDSGKSDDSDRDQAKSEKSEKQSSQDSQSDKQKSSEKSAANNPQSQKDQSDDSHSKDGDSQSGSSQSKRSASKSKNGMIDESHWKIERLLPGESRTIMVTALSDSEGVGNVCLTVESYVPTLCLKTRFTKPELEIVKQAPQVANICDEIRFDYLVRNTGTGNLERFTVRDDLPDGLKTVEGENKLEFTLEDGLKAGEVRKFEARLRATATGDFTSRAMVKGPEGVQATSNRAGTKVRQADLAIALSGPQAQELGGLANYTVRVTNRGDAPAPDTQLRIYYPRSADLVRASQPRASSRDVNPSTRERSGSHDQQASHEHGSQSGDHKSQKDDNASSKQSSDQNEGDRKQKQEDKQQQTDKQQQSDKQNDSEQQADKDQKDSEKSEAKQRRAQNRENQDRQDMAQHFWRLGTLEPGQTVEVTYVLRPYEGGDLHQAAVAEYVCATAQDREMLRAEAETTTELMKLTGLRVTVIDDHDPVAAGQNVTYTVTVLNQGNSAAHNVEITATLPKELKFVDSKGATTGENSDDEVKFKPVETLAAGKKAVWQIVAKVNDDVSQETQSSIDVELNSDDLDESVTSQEPTTLFQGEKRTAKATGESESKKK